MVNIVRIFLFGVSEAGKTQLINKIVHRKFSHQKKPTIGMDFSVEETKEQKIYYWDTAGDDSFLESLEIFANSFCKSDRIVFCYDLCNPQSSLQYLKKLLDNSSFVEKITASDDFFLVGTKTDLVDRMSGQNNAHLLEEAEREIKEKVSALEGKKFHRFSVNSINGYGIEELKKRISQAAEETKKLQGEEETYKEILHPSHVDSLYCFNENKWAFSRVRCTKKLSDGTTSGGEFIAIEGMLEGQCKVILIRKSEEDDTITVTEHERHLSFQEMITEAGFSKFYSCMSPYSLNSQEILSKVEGLKSRHFEKDWSVAVLEEFGLRNLSDANVGIGFKDIAIAFLRFICAPFLKLRAWIKERKEKRKERALGKKQKAGDKSKPTSASSGQMRKSLETTGAENGKSKDVPVPDDNKDLTGSQQYTQSPGDTEGVSPSPSLSCGCS